ncbi:hypothetical protein PVAP13_5KG262407 [Panicum virgatum]|uniref:Uncharacterized protein n=1 Tax=Panicum virgatum TaxID=38727 RepID=A0A8T0SG50_PANVG|nr:hypothetical protein PVAP13_5KG262407 [Panicum virgatum]
MYISRTRAPPGQPWLGAPFPSLAVYTACSAPHRRRIWRPHPPSLVSSTARGFSPPAPAPRRPGWSRRCSLLAMPLARVPRRGFVAALRQAHSSASTWQEHCCHGPISLLLRSSKAVVRPRHLPLRILRHQTQSRSG